MMTSKISLSRVELLADSKNLSTPRLRSCQLNFKISLLLMIQTLIQRELPAREGGDESSFLRLPFFDIMGRVRLRKLAHGVYRTQYHIVWITRYRRKILMKGVKDYLKIKLEEIRKYYPVKSCFFWKNCDSRGILFLDVYILLVPSQLCGLVSHAAPLSRSRPGTGRC